MPCGRLGVLFAGPREHAPFRRRSAAVCGCPCADAIFYVLRTGCQWQALDQTELVPHSTAHDRYQAWVQADVFLKLWEMALEDYDELKGIDWSLAVMDGAMTKAPLGGKKPALIRRIGPKKALNAVC